VAFSLFAFELAFGEASDGSFHVEYRSPVCAAEALATVRHLRILILNNFRRAARVGALRHRYSRCFGCTIRQTR